MTSNDAVIINLINSRFDAFDNRMDALEVRMGNVERKTEELHAEIQNTREELHTEIRAVERATEINTVKLEELRFSFNIWFTVIAVIIGFVGCITSLAPTIREIFQTRRENKITEERIKFLIDEGIMRAMSDKMRT